MPTVHQSSAFFSDIVGLSNKWLTIVFVLVSVLVFLWGFERYRTYFSKVELGLSVALSLAIFTLGVFPGVFGAISGFLEIDGLFQTVSILANIGFVFLILYIISLVSDNRNTVGELTRGITAQQALLDEPSEEQSVYIVIPAYNEEETIGGVLADLPETVCDHVVHPIVVSDGSTDQTRRVAENHDALVVEHPINQGQGGALKTGFEIASRHGADIVVTMDADGQHPANQLEDLVQPIVDDEADHVLGSRYHGEDESGNSMTRRTGIRVFTWVINIMAKTDIADCTNGFRAIRGSKLPEMTLTEERFSAPELIIESRKQGLRIKQVPVTILEREEGETKKPTIRYAIGLARTIVATWIR